MCSEAAVILVIIMWRVVAIERPGPRRTCPAVGRRRSRGLYIIIIINRVISKKKILSVNTAGGIHHVHENRFKDKILL